MSSAALERDEGAFQALDDGPALVGANSLAQLRTGSLLAQPRFHPVEVLDLPQDPACCFW
jgi:hypothetical protein